MKHLALLALAAAAFYYLRSSKPPPAPPPGAGEEELASARRANSFDPVCAALRKDLGKIDQALTAPHADLQYAYNIRQRVRAAGQPLPEHVTLVQLCDLLIHANEERDAQRAGLQTQAAAKPYVSPLDSRKRGAAPPADPRPDLSTRFEQHWEDYRQQTTATAKRLLASLEGKSVR